MKSIFYSQSLLYKIEAVIFFPNFNSSHEAFKLEMRSINVSSLHGIVRPPIG